MKTRRSAADSSLKSRFSTENILRGPQFALRWKIETTIHPISKDRRVPKFSKTPRSDMWSLDSRASTKIWTEPIRPRMSLRSPLLLLLLLAAMSMSSVASQSVPFLGMRGSRVMTFNGKTQRDIVVSFVRNISEEALAGTWLASFRAEDTTFSGRNLTFRIDRQSDPKRQFSIAQNGILKVARELDREDRAKYTLQIEAFDQAGNEGSQTMEIYVMDVNDNAPLLHTSPDPCIFMENTDPSQQLPCEIIGEDPDTPVNGAPFTMNMSPADNRFITTFHPQVKNGSMTVKPNVRFDREDPSTPKIIYLHIEASDSGKPRMTEIRQVPIVIGDQNDNQMFDGSMTIYVNSYLGRLESTVIGRVYVEDKDDWDLPDKTFEWSRTLNGFAIDRNTGAITMDANMRPGTYELEAKVTDTTRNEQAIGKVTVIVNEVTSAAFNNHGAVRLFKGADGLLDSAEFIRKDANGMSKMDRFRNRMSGYLGGAQIEIFSISETETEKQYGNISVVDVRFSAHGSAYRSPILLNGLVSQHRAELEKEVGVKIVAVSIDECKFTECDNECQTKNYPSFEAEVVNGNRTVMVGVKTVSNSSCVCPIYHPSEQCQQDSCLNQGVCHNTEPGFFCECRNALLKGPRCQGRTRSFGGSGFAWFKPIPACTSLNVSFDFMTSSPTGLLFYAGPMLYEERNNIIPSNFNPNIIEYRDYVMIYLLNGQLLAELTFNGDYEKRSVLQINSQNTLNDGKWHNVLLVQNGQSLELVVDNCAKLLSMGSNTSQCLGKAQTLDDDERLNIADPIQIGGVAPDGQYPSAIRTIDAFDGCIRNLNVNNELYDLANPPHSESSEIGCKHYGGACDSNSVQSSASYCVHGDCYAEIEGAAMCICDPGYMGERCEKAIEWMQFGSGSYIQYVLHADLSSTTTKSQSLIILDSENKAGQLGLVRNRASGQYITTLINSNHAAAAFNLDTNADNRQDVILDWHPLKKGMPYYFEFERTPLLAEVSIDGIYHQSKSLNLDFHKYIYDSEKDLVLGNGDFGDFTGCIRDFRWDSLQLPLQQKDEYGMNAGVRTISAVTRGCSLIKTCAQLGQFHCPGSQVCMDFWKGPFCTCPIGSNALLNEDGTLTGCGETLAVSSLGISSKAVVLILVCLFVLLMLVLLMVAYTRRQTPPFERVRPEEMSRENMRPYDIEGGGEADNDTYNISGLRKPVMPPEMNGFGHTNGHLQKSPSGPPIDDNLKTMIKDMESDPNSTAPYDELRVYDDEGDAVSHCSVSTLSSAGGDPATLDEKVSRWGPRFNKLAGMYGQK